MLLSARTTRPISRRELERRWSAVRAAMADAGIEALVMQNNNPASGYVRYFADIVAGGNPTSIVFPIEGGMTVVRHGALGGRRELTDDEDPTLPGVARVLTTAHFNTAFFTRDYDGELVLGGLEPYARGRIGLVGTSEMSDAFGQRLRQGLRRAELVDATDLVDRIKVIKSPEEQELIRATAALQDGAMQRLLDELVPGRRERDVVASIAAWSSEQGSDHGLYMLGSAPAGQPALLAPPPLQNRTLERGDVVSVLIENSGPGGYYTELGRTCVLGAAPGGLIEELEFAREAQRFCLERLVPGTACAELWEQYNEFMREHGRSEETRLHCHGQGYDLVERPLVRFDEPLAIAAGMNIVCHPGYARNGVWSWICDNYLIGEDGPGQSLHATEQRIFEL